MNPRVPFVIGLVVSIGVGVVATVHLVGLGLRLDALAADVTTGTVIFGGCGMLAGVLGAAVFLGLLMRPAAPPLDQRAPDEMPDP